MLELSTLPESLTKLIASPRDVALVGLLMAAAFIDWRSYKIPNWLTVGGMVIGLLYNAGTSATWHAGLLTALAGLGTGLLVLLPLYALRVMGAGDVKLMAMVGAFVGLPDVIYAVLYALIAGGLAAVCFALYHKASRRMATNIVEIAQFMTFASLAGCRPTPALASRDSVGKLPYGVSIAAGTMVWLVVRVMGF